MFQIWDNDRFSFDDFLGKHCFQSGPFSKLPADAEPLLCVCAILGRAGSPAFCPQGAQSCRSPVLSKVCDTDQWQSDQSGQWVGLEAQ